MSRSMVKLVHADDFFPNNDANNLLLATKDMSFVNRPYGLEIADFNLIFPDIESIFYRVLGERVTVDPKRSGVIRKPHNNAIHYEQFDSPEEWCFIVALEKTTLNIWHHISDQTQGELSQSDYTNAMQGADFNYYNLFEWKIQTNIVLEQNQGVFIRPWMFHSLDDGIVQYYRLIADTKYRILVMGYPGSKKSSVAENLAKRIQNCELINSMQQRINRKDLDFSQDGQLRHCYRMLNKIRSSLANVVILDMSCPLEKMRQILNPDIIVWVSDKIQCQYDEINQMYQVPVQFDVECKDNTDLDIDNIIKRVISKRP